MKLTCLLLALAALSGAFPASQYGTTEEPAEAKSHFAMLDDVRLLANGLLQLGHGLREFVHKTKGQITDIFQKIGTFDKSFSQLFTITSEIKEDEEALKKTTAILKAGNQEVMSLSLEINTKMNGILQDRSRLQRKVVELEEKLSSFTHGHLPAEQMNEISALKDVIDVQEKCISDLLKAVKEQHEQLNHQKIKIKTLEEKLNVDSFQDVSREPVGVKHEPPSLTGYVLNASASTKLDINGLPIDCQEVFNRGERNSGVYLIKPNQSEPFYVYCDMSTDGGSTVIQRRQDGSVDFDQTWEKYESGFGSFIGEFWLGLEKIHSISRQGTHILQVELEDWRQARHRADYLFTLEGATSHYAIHITHLGGDLADALSNHTGTAFSTKDKDHDGSTDANCAHSYTGGWWFSACGDTNLNGKYTHGRARSRAERRKGVFWGPHKGSLYSPRSTKLSIHRLRHTGDLH